MRLLSSLGRAALVEQAGVPVSRHPLHERPAAGSTWCRDRIERGFAVLRSRVGAGMLRAECGRTELAAFYRRYCDVARLDPVQGDSH
jgi:hypothetical protein